MNNKDKIAKVFIWGKNNDKIKNIMNNISKVINIKYGKEYNNIVNNTPSNNIIEPNHSIMISLDELINYYKNIYTEDVNQDFINFIDDFHNIYELGEINSDFIINLDIITKWLDTKKGKLKETLVRTYNKNIDYTVSKEKSGKISKSNKEIIMLTPDCFKRLCLLSKTKKAEEVRTYFIELEKLLNNYKNYIIDGMKATINILENNQKPIPKNIKGCVYVLKSLKDIDGIYRFGKTDDFRKRLANYNSANSDKMEVIYIYETKNMQEIEDCVIAQIKKHRYKKRKDFYQIDVNVLKSLINDCNALTLSYKKKLKMQDGGGDNNLYLYLSAGL
jgi:phage anti-repressor protein